MDPRRVDRRAALWRAGRVADVRARPAHRRRADRRRVSGSARLQSDLPLSDRAADDRRPRGRVVAARRRARDRRRTASVCCRPRSVDGDSHASESSATCARRRCLSRQPIGLTVFRRIDSRRRGPRAAQLAHVRIAGGERLRIRRRSVSTGKRRAESRPLRALAVADAHANPRARLRGAVRCRAPGGGVGRARARRRDGSVVPPVPRVRRLVVHPLSTAGDPVSDRVERCNRLACCRGDRPHGTRKPWSSSVIGAVHGRPGCHRKRTRRLVGRDRAPAACLRPSSMGAPLCRRRPVRARQAATECRRRDREAQRQRALLLAAADHRMGHARSSLARSRARLPA